MLMGQISMFVKNLAVSLDQTGSCLSPKLKVKVNFAFAFSGELNRGLDALLHLAV